MDNLHIRWMIRRDMVEVLHIENETYHVPWCEDDFLYCLRQRNVIGMVAEIGEVIVGYVIYELHYKRLHIINFAVHPSNRRQRIGSMMVKKLLGKLSYFRRSKITLYLRESNLAAQLFLRAKGFEATQVIRHYYEDTGEDAYYMERRSSTVKPSPARYATK